MASDAERSEIEIALRKRLDELDMAHELTSAQIALFVEMFHKASKGEGNIYPEDRSSFLQYNSNTQLSDSYYYGQILAIFQYRSEQFMIDGAPEIKIGNSVLTALPPLDLQEKVNLVLHYCIMNEGGNHLPQIFKAAGIDRVATRLEDEYRLRFPRSPDIYENRPIYDTRRRRVEKFKGPVDAREKQREEMLAAFFDPNMTTSQRNLVIKKYIDPIDDAVVKLGNKAPEVICPITQRFMVNPVKLGEHYFEKDALERWLHDKKTHPATGLKLEDGQQPIDAPEMRTAIMRIINSQLARSIHDKALLQELPAKKYHEQIQPKWASKETWTTDEQKQDRPIPKKKL